MNCQCNILLANLLVLSIWSITAAGAQQPMPGSPWTRDEQAKINQADKSIATLESQRLQEVADYQKEQAAAQAEQQQIAAAQKLGTNRLSVLSSLLTQYKAAEKRDWDQIQTIDKWIKYWQGQKQQIKWNISQDQQIVQDQQRAQQEQAQSLADQAATRAGHQHYKALKRAGQAPAGGPFNSDGWTSIPFYPLSQ